MVYILQQEALTYRLYRDRELAHVSISLWRVILIHCRVLIKSNILIKYADDTNLLVPEHTESILNQEFTHICDWAQQNKMCINITKRKELVFHRPHPISTKFDMPFALDGIVQEHVAKLLEVFFSDKLGFDDHVNFMLTVCSQRVYMLKLLTRCSAIAERPRCRER